MVRYLSIRVLAPALILTSCSSIPSSAPPLVRPVGIARPLLAAHNRERAAFGSPPLAWDDRLASAAAHYADKLARLGRLQHSPGNLRPGQGENLWIGTSGAYSLEAMVAGWAAERRHFRPGRFPAISRTRNWADVGHFTQIVWPATRVIGCGLGKSARWEVLVCRYSPPGNVDGGPISRN